ncbi:transposase family protein [Streptomyces lateritius]|uniref:Transposase family protein n=1 Tax=Streptomyces lateritius TaxID=67313 RepID=A0ABW6YB93_9ACTN
MPSPSRPHPRPSSRPARAPRAPDRRSRGGTGKRAKRARHRPPGNELVHDVLACWFGVDRPTITRAVDKVRPLLAERRCTVSPEVRLRILAEAVDHLGSRGMTGSSRKLRGQPGLGAQTGGRVVTPPHRNFKENAPELAHRGSRHHRGYPRLTACRARARQTRGPRRPPPAGPRTRQSYERSEAV